MPTELCWNTNTNCDAIVSIHNIFLGGKNLDSTFCFEITFRFRGGKFGKSFICLFQGKVTHRVCLIPKASCLIPEAGVASYQSWGFSFGVTVSGTSEYSCWSWRWPEKYQEWDCRTESDNSETKSRNWQCEETGKGAFEYSNTPVCMGFSVFFFHLCYRSIFS